MDFFIMTVDGHAYIGATKDGACMEANLRQFIRDALHIRPDSDVVLLWGDLRKAMESAGVFGESKDEVAVQMLETYGFNFCAGADIKDDAKVVNVGAFDGSIPLSQNDVVIQNVIKDGLDNMAVIVNHENSDARCDADTVICDSVEEAVRKVCKEYKFTLRTLGIPDDGEDGEQGTDGEPDYRCWSCGEDGANVTDGMDSYSWDIETIEGFSKKDLFVVSGYIRIEPGESEIIQPVLVRGRSVAQQVMGDTIRAISKNPMYNCSKGIKRSMKVADTTAELHMEGGLGGMFYSALKVQLAIHELTPGKQVIPIGTARPL